MKDSKLIIYSLLLVFGLFANLTIAQNTIIDGYAFESNNRGFLNQVYVKVFDQDSVLLAESTSEPDGHFVLDSLIGIPSYLIGSKTGFEEKLLAIDQSDDSKIFVQLEMDRLEGYIFEITLAESRQNENIIVDAISGANIEVYNNTAERMELVLEDHKAPDFQIQLYKNNHYTILIRKSGYLSKRMEAYVNVEGCILCFEGVGNVRPGVSENLTDQNLRGVLLANVELEKVYTGKEFKINNLYYEFNSSRITNSAKEILNTLIVLLKDNPYLNVELGSHTDSRGNEKANLTLSQKRAESAVRYILRNSNIPKARLSFKGYGESLPINSCIDNVECTEEEHALNRRTEIKILGIDPNIESISLAERIRQDKEEKLIEELLDQEQIFIPESDSVKLDDTISHVEDTLQLKNTFTEELDVDSIQRSNDVTESLKRLVESANINEEDMPPFNNYYSVAFMYSKREVDKDSEVWTLNAVQQYRSTSGHYIYHVGQFDNEQSAIDYNELYIKPLYPNAFIVKFINGDLHVNFK